MKACYFCQGKVVNKRIRHVHHWGDEIVIFEKDAEIGGMAASYCQSYAGKKYFIEKYYHHIFRSDLELLALIRELGLENQMLWLKGGNAYFVNGKNYPMNTPF